MQRLDRVGFVTFLISMVILSGCLGRGGQSAESESFQVVPAPNTSNEPPLKSVVPSLTPPAAPPSEEPPAVAPPEISEPPTSAPVETRADDTILVGSAMIGQRAVQSFVSRSLVESESGELDALETHGVIDSRVRAQQGERDAFNRKVDVVQVQDEVTTYLDDSSDVPEVAARVRVTHAFEVASGDLVYVERQVLCDSADPCDEDEDASAGRVERDYPRNVGREAWSSLEGRLLKLGQTLALERPRGDASEPRVFLRYTPVREEFVGGMRTFVVEVDWDYQDDLGTTQESESDSPTGWIWLGENVAVPVKETARVPHAIRDQVQWDEYESSLTFYEPGSEPIDWGQGTPLPDVYRQAYMEFRPAWEFVQTGTEGLAYGLTDAWRNVGGDPSLVALAAYRADHRDARLIAASYYPRTEEGVFTWSFVVGDGSQQNFLIESRQIGEGTASVVQNRATNQSSSLHAAPASLDDWRVAEFGSFSALLESYRLRAGAVADPIVVIDLGAAQDGRAWNPVVSFFDRAEVENHDGPAPGANEHEWAGSTSFDFSLRDGGLDGLNARAAQGHDAWPWAAAAVPWALLYQVQGFVEDELGQVP